MNYSADKQSNDPAYIRLYRQLREDIVSGVYAFGERLPSKRLLADESGVSVITVEHAYALLLEEGYVESRQRSGYFVIFRVEEGFAGTGQNLYAEEKMEMPLPQGTEMTFPFSVLARTMRSVLSDYGESLLSRSPNEGTSFLRTEISRYLARSRGIAVPPERIIIGSGSEYLYNLIIGVLGRDKTYGIEDPSYAIIEKTYRLSGVDLEFLPLGKDGLESAALKSCRAQVLHLTPYRSFPSGVTASASKRHEYIRWARMGRYLVEDDYESEFSVLKKPEDTLFSQAENDNVIYMNTFTKSISPSLRVGYMLLPEHLIPVFRERLGVFSCTVPTAIQYVLAELLRNGDFERHINRVRRAKRKELQTYRRIR
ncbi:MAG: PLP-dependent aminotransferase family protein [Lachnospiraceae bacterium]|nr:PLP-dependent aminotransferase family protein [Lachnospiraceae bacterium]